MNAAPPSSGRPRSEGATRAAAMAAILGVALILHAFLASAILSGRGEYFGSASLQPNPDAYHYMVLGKNLAEGNGFSRMEEAPYDPDALRTPAYPVLLMALRTISGSVWPVFLAQAACFLLTVVLVRRVALHYLGEKAALGAAALYATDLMLISLNFETMTEPLFNLLATLGLALFHDGLAGRARGRNALPWFAGAGLAVGLAVLTRPTGLYVGPVLCLGALAGVRTRKDFLSLIRPLAAFAAVVLLAVAPWMARNQQVFGFFRLTTVDAMNMVYYAGAGPYQLKHGVELAEAQDSIRREFNLNSNVEHHNPWTTGRTVAELDAQLRSVTREVLLRHPHLLPVSTALGLAKSSLAHNTAALGEISGAGWDPPGMSNLLRGRVGGFLSGLSANRPWLIAVFLYESLQALVLCGLFALGALVLASRLAKNRLPAVPLLLAAYFIVTMGMGGLDATPRFRSALLPVACIVAMVGAAWLAGACGRFAALRSGRGGRSGKAAIGASGFGAGLPIGTDNQSRGMIDPDGRDGEDPGGIR